MRQVLWLRKIDFTNIFKHLDGGAFSFEICEGGGEEGW